MRATERRRAEVGLTQPVPHSLHQFGGTIDSFSREPEFWRVEGYNHSGGSISLTACYTREEALSVRKKAKEDGIEDFDSQGKLPNRHFDTWYIVHYTPMVRVVVEDYE